MKSMAIIALIVYLVASPVMAGMIQVQEADEAATCELRSAGMVTPAPENSVVFPQDSNCLSAETESRELPQEEGAGAVEIAGYSPTTKE